MSPNYAEVIKKYSGEMDGTKNEVELHRPFIDDVTITCPECGKQMHRVPEVIDCWFDSGAMPFAQHHYPFENQELFHQAVPGPVYFRGRRPDKRLVLFASCGIHASV